ncbi:hypothetical protein FB451DRAFT_1415404 [Mycena latifolia]|nr:hypothetical protein FB451DRAFT_1415404 [Mycena latifolia]
MHLPALLLLTLTFALGARAASGSSPASASALCECPPRVVQRHAQQLCGAPERLVDWWLLLCHPAVRPSLLPLTLFCPQRKPYAAALLSCLTACPAGLLSAEALVEHFCAPPGSRRALLPFLRDLILFRRFRSLFRSSEVGPGLQHSDGTREFLVHVEQRSGTNTAPLARQRHTNRGARPTSYSSSAPCSYSPTRAAVSLSSASSRPLRIRLPSHPASASRIALASFSFYKLTRALAVPGLWQPSLLCRFLLPRVLLSWR